MQCNITDRQVRDQTEVELEHSDRRTELKRDLKLFGRSVHIIRMMMSKIRSSGTTRMLFLGPVISSLLVSALLGQAAQEAGTSVVLLDQTSSRVIPTPPQKVSPYRSVSPPKHARDFYQAVWGVDSLSVKSVESGQMIRFSYRVLDAEKAKPLNDKKAMPYLIDENARVKLVVPTMEKVGQLRQSSPPEADKVYWMVFSNKGGIVKRGDRITVEIGKFRVGGLVVQ
jgi:hypothetical protein